MDNQFVNFDRELLKERQPFVVSTNYRDVDGDINQAILELSSGGNQYRSAASEFIG